MASLASLLEDYRNWRGKQEWDIGRDKDILSQYDPELVDFVDKMSGMGTDAGGLVGMIKASHGSPHMFDKFDFSRIGSGEGNQAYGHGGYFAQGFDSPVAQSYISAGRAVNAPDRTTEMVARALDASGGVEEKAKEWLANRLKTSPSDFSDLYQDAINRFDEVKPTGSLYNVEIKWPDPAREAADPLGEHHLLDWDEALSKQPEGVRNAFNEFVNSPEGESLAKEYWSYKPGMKLSDLPEWNDVSGEAIYKNALGTSGDWKSASEMLKKHGIPGIRYLDQASRGTGTGTRNYVMFDDRFPEIVSRNGVSLSDLLRR